MLYTYMPLATPTAAAESTLGIRCSGRGCKRRAVETAKQRKQPTSNVDDQVLHLIRAKWPRRYICRFHFQFVFLIYWCSSYFLTLPYIVSQQMTYD